MMKCIACFTIALAVPFSAVAFADEPPAAAQPEATDTPADKVDAELLESLGDSLFDDLDDALMEDLEEPEAAPAGGDQPSDAELRLDEDLLRELGGDEPPAEGDPLLEVGQQMRTVAERLEQRSAGDATQKMQQEIVARLDKLMEQLNQQQQSQSSSSNSQQQQSASRRQQVQQPQQRPGQGQQPRQQRGNQSTDRVGSADAARPDPDEFKEMVKAVWGHLPENTRQQLLQSAPDEYLPKYQFLIEQYYRRLIDRRNPPR